MWGSEATGRALEIVGAPTDRDRQRHVGPSELGEVCERCLADKIRGTYEDKRAGTPLAPLLGTAFHLLAQQRLSNSPEGRAGLVLVEKRVDVAQVDGYGPIRGTVDLFDIERREVIDWKVLSKARMAGISSVVHNRLDGSVLMDRDKIIWETAWKYYAQMMLYGYALERDGYEVERASLLMIPRDASTDVLPGAARTLVFQYRRAVAEAVLGRFSELVARVRNEENEAAGVSSGEYESSPGCYRCKRLKKEEADMAAWGGMP